MAKKEFNKKFSLFDHFDEIRVRLVRSLWIFFGGFLFCYSISNAWIMDFLRQPLFDVLPEGAKKLYFTGLFENFMTHLKVGAISALFLLCPYFFWEFWAFVSPGLLPKEKKYVIPFLLLATVFFIGGAAFAYYGLFPIAFKFFVEFGLNSDAALLTIGNYYSTVLKLLLLFGIAFELPVMILLLGLLGIVTPRMLRQNRRYAVVGITVFCAMFAPPDVISMVLMMIPLYLMFESMILILGWLGVGKKVSPADAHAKNGKNAPGLLRKSTHSVELHQDSVNRETSRK